VSQLWRRLRGNSRVLNLRALASARVPYELSPSFLEQWARYDLFSLKAFALSYYCTARDGGSA
jgi:hypothetical protein